MDAMFTVSGFEEWLQELLAAKCKEMEGRELCEIVEYNEWKLKVPIIICGNYGVKVFDDKVEQYLLSLRDKKHSLIYLYERNRFIVLFKYLAATNTELRNSGRSEWPREGFLQSELDTERWNKVVEAEIPRTSMFWDKLILPFLPERKRFRMRRFKAATKAVELGTVICEQSYIILNQLEEILACWEAINDCLFLRDMLIRYVGELKLRSME